MDNSEPLNVGVAWIEWTIKCLRDEPISDLEIEKGCRIWSIVNLDPREAVRLVLSLIPEIHFVAERHDACDLISKLLDMLASGLLDDVLHTHWKELETPVARIAKSYDDFARLLRVVDQSDISDFVWSSWQIAANRSH